MPGQTLVHGAYPPVIELSSLNGTNGFRLSGAVAGDRTGTAVAGIGDFNDDGIDDILISAPEADSNGLKGGVSYVVFGSTQATGANVNLSTLDGSNGFAIGGVATYDYAGTAAAAAGDINGDTINDLVIGAPQSDTNGNLTGSAYVLFGSGAPWNASFPLSSLNGVNGIAIQGVDGSDFAGRSVGAAGDVNGDDFDDLIVSAPYAETGMNNGESGHSYIIFGSNLGLPNPLNLSSLDGSNGFALYGEGTSDLSGFSVSGNGDVNGDGLDDVLIGAYRAGPFGNDAGKTYVVFGDNQAWPASIELSTLNGNNGLVIDGVNAEDYSGHSVASGDFNGDGLYDTLIGAWGVGVANGAAYVVFGTTQAQAASLSLSSLDGNNGFLIDGAGVGDLLGRSVATAGDINGDGVDDLIVSAWGSDPNGLSSGSVYVVMGSRSGFSPTFDVSVLDGSNGFVINGVAAADLAGFAVAGAGDFNGDGVDDVIIGAPQADPNGDQSGAAYVVFGVDRVFSDGFE